MSQRAVLVERGGRVRRWDLCDIVAVALVTGSTLGLGVLARSLVGVVLKITVVVELLLLALEVSEDAVDVRLISNCAELTHFDILLIGKSRKDTLGVSLVRQTTQETHEVVAHGELFQRTRKISVHGVLAQRTLEVGVNRELAELAFQVRVNLFCDKTDTCQGSKKKITLTPLLSEFRKC